MFYFFLGARELFDSPELERFAHAINIVQRRYPSMTIGQLSSLLRVGMTPAEEGQNVSVSDIAEQSGGQKYPTLARQLDLLGAGTEKNPGMGLIEKGVAPSDKRTRWVAISQRGKDLLYELDLILSPEIVKSIGQRKSTKDGKRK